EPFESAGKKFNRGSYIVRNTSRADLDRAAAELGVEVTALGAPPGVKTHPVRAARIVLVHTWLSTQTEGWWRLALDKLGIPYDYRSTQAIAKFPARTAKTAVIRFPPVGYNAGVTATVIAIPPAWANPL